MATSFKKQYDADARAAESKRVRERYPERVPVIVERASGCNAIIPLCDKHKFLVPHDLTAGQLCYVIRRRIKLAPEHALFILVNGRLMQSSALISSIYSECKDKDGFLYVHYSGESVFG